MRLKATIPLLRIFDLTKADEFYAGFLGFQTDWEHRFGDEYPLYRQVSRGGAVLHLSEHHGDAAPGAHVILMIEGVAALHEELTAKAYPYAKPGLDDWIGGGRCVVVTDPFFNKLTFAGEA